MKGKELLQEVKQYSRVHGYPVEDILAAKILSEQTGLYWEDILVENWFTDKLKATKDSVSKFMKGVSKSAGAAKDGAKQAWAKNVPDIYGQGSHKFWRHKEMAEKAHEQFVAIQNKLDQKFEKEFKQQWEGIKDALKDAEKPSAEGELAFPNNKRTEDFYKIMFGLENWDEIDSNIQNIIKGKIKGNSLGGIFGAMLTMKIAMQSSLDNSIDVESVPEKLKKYNGYLAAFRKLLQRYAQDVKGMYQTTESSFVNPELAFLFEDANMTDYNDIGDLLADLEGDNEEQENAEETLEDLLANSDAISDDQLQSLKNSSDPKNMLIAAAVAAIVAGIGIKINGDAYNAFVAAGKAAEGPKEVIQNVAQEVTKTFSIVDGHGFTESLNDAFGSNLNPKSTMKEVLAVLKENGLNAESFEGVLGDSKAAFEAMAEANPDQTAGSFFSGSFDGKTMQSIFGVNQGSVIKWISKQMVKQLVKVGGSSAATTLFAAPISGFLVNSAIAAVPAFLTIAALRKWKKNRKKTILEMIDILKDLEGVTPDSEVMEIIDKIGELPDGDQDNIGFDPSTIPVTTSGPGGDGQGGPNGDGDGSGDGDGDGDGEDGGGNGDDGQDGDGGEGDGGGTSTNPLAPENAAECDQTELGLLKFMKNYNSVKFSTKPGDGQPKKMSTIFKNGRLNKNFANLTPEKLRADLEATAERYNNLLNADIWEVSEDPKQVEDVLKHVSSNENAWHSGEIMVERWQKLAGIIKG